MDDLLREFLTETGEHLDTVDTELVRLEQNPDDREILRHVFRLVHTIKGTCGFLGLPRLEALAHAAESLMGRLRDGAPTTGEAVSLILSTIDRIKLILAELTRAAVEPEGQDGDLIAALERAADAAAPADAPALMPAPLPFQTAGAGASDEAPAAPEPAGAPPVPEQPAGPQRARAARSANPTIRVGLDTLEHLMTMVSELVLTRNQLLDVARRMPGEGSFGPPLQRLSHVTAELQDGIMKTRMQPIGSAWAKLPRVLRDLGSELGKTIELQMHGAETELDRQILELIRDPLTHMVRNSADHGIEPPAERLRAGKPAHGTIRLTAFHEGGTITIEVADDGRGLDHAGIRRRAAALGLAGEAELARMGDEQLALFIFHPGFSTSRGVTAVSGRGVGMDVVRTNVAAIGGTVEIASRAGQGVLFTVKIPLTLAIVAALIVECGGQRFALPQVSVVELVRVRPGGGGPALERINGQPVLRLREDLLPVVDLAELMGLAPVRPQPDDGFVAVARVGRQRFGILVDGVLETEEIVVKPMSARLRHLPLFSGNTVLGDGAVVLIVDPNGIVRAAGSELLRGVAEIAEPQPAHEDLDEALTLLVFKAGDGALKAIPLSLVTRLEEVEAGAIEHVGGRPHIQYRGRLMPIVAIDGAGALQRDGTQPLIVIAREDRPVALAVNEIVDVVECATGIDPLPDCPDLVGTAIVRGRATEIVDISAFLPDGPDANARAAFARTVLLVDDNVFFRDLLQPVLRAAGYRVRTARDAAGALRILSNERVAALVTDLDLPGRSGLDLVEDLRRLAGGRDVTAVMLCSNADTAVLARARELGIFDVVAKFDRSGLLSSLAEGDGLQDAAA